MLLQMEEPPEFLAEGAYEEFAPAPEAERVARFLESAESAGLVTSRKQAGTYKLGHRVLDPERFLQDFAGVSDELWLFRDLLQELGRGEAVVRARVHPRVTPEEAAEALGGKATLEHVPVLVGHFRIAVRYYAEKQVAALFAVDLETGEACPERLESLRAVAGAEAEALGAGKVRQKVLTAGLEKLRALALEHAEGLFHLAQAEVVEERANRRAAMEGYFEGLEEEYAKEERRMFYHLYYFDQQEKLAARRKADLAERQALVAGDERYYQVESEIEPEGLALLLLPVYRKDKASLCALSARTL